MPDNYYCVTENVPFPGCRLSNGAEVTIKILMPTYLDEAEARRNSNTVESIVANLVDQLAFDPLTPVRIDPVYEKYTGINYLLEVTIQVTDAISGFIGRTLRKPITELTDLDEEVVENIVRVIGAALDDFTPTNEDVQLLQQSIERDLNANKSVLVIGYSTASKPIIEAIRGMTISDPNRLAVFLIAPTDSIPTDNVFSGYTTELDDDFVRSTFGAPWNVDNSRNVVLARTVFLDTLGHSLIPFYLDDGLETRTALRGTDAQIVAALRTLANN
ncbi:MAG: hypothetical protein HRT81_17865 [Henriciella sp.]|nr:hypothetical protein [Henriciella sp.]